MPVSVSLPPRVVTDALRGIEQRRPGALEEFWRLVYAWVVERARMLLHGEPLRSEVGDAEDLAHEAFLKLKPAHLGACRDRKHLIRIATRAMRQALVDRARRRRVAGGVVLGLDDVLPQALSCAPELQRPLDLALALDALQAVNPRTAEVATLHLVGGLNFVEIGRVLAMSEAWARLAWGRAAAWLEARGGS